MRVWLFLFSILLAGCSLSKAPVAEPASTKTGNAISAHRDKLTDQIAGTLQAAKFTNDKQPDSRFKVVIDMFLSDGLRLTGAPTIETQTTFEQTATQLLSDDVKARSSGEAARLRLAGENAALKAQIDRLEAEYKAQLERERAEGNARLEAAKLEAQAKERRTITWIFYGGGAILLAAAAGMVFLGGSIPFVGPRAAMAVGGAGAALIGTGILITQLAKHPWVLWTGLVVAGLALVLSLGLMIANQHHAKSSP